MSTLNIAIIGAGPAGCTLARLLLQPKTPSKVTLKVTIFEAEESLDFRSQGGTLDLHEHTGQKALKAAGLFEEFEKFARYDGEAMKIADKNLLCYVKMSGSKDNKPSTGRPEIDRPQLRKLLFESLPPDTVRWGHKLQKVDADNMIHFANGTTDSSFDLIVGASGAWCKVRPRLSDAKPFYSGIGGHALRIPNAQETHPELYDLVDRGSLFAWSDAKGILPQYMSDGSINIGTWSLRPEKWQQECGYDVHDAAAVKQMYEKEYADWDPRMRAFIQAAEDKVVPRDLFMLPIGHKWEHVPGVTLIGDAAHLATPFAGEGVNLAMEDSLKLAEAILGAKDKTDLDLRVKGFEEDMFVRATAMQQTTYDMLSAMYHVKGAPRVGIESYLCKAIGYGASPVLMFFVRPLVYTYFFFFKMFY